jgi:dTDP-4-dehydrorhamnose reductase
VAVDAAVSRVLITGGGGMLGGSVATALAGLGHEVHTADRHDRAPVDVVRHVAELSAPGAFDAVVAAVRPDLVVHTAYSMEDLDRDVVVATTNVAAACAAHGAGLLHISTDAVFDGEHPTYAEGDVPEPVHPYGVAKRRVELEVLDAVPDATIVRTSLIVHLDPEMPDSATAWVVDANRDGRTVTLFTDEVRTAVRLVDLTAVVVELVDLDPSDRRGFWHVAGPERLSRADIGAVIATAFDLDRDLIAHAPSSSVAGPRPRDVSLSAARAAAELSVRPAPVATLPRHGQAHG